MNIVNLIHTIRGRNHLRFAFNPLSSALALGTWLAAGAALALTGRATANDNFANAIALTGIASGQTGDGFVGTQTGTNNAGATFEAGEPASGGVKTVWFKWTCPASGNLTVSTLGSTNAGPAEWDAVLGIYSGAAVNTLTPLGSTPQDSVLQEVMTIPVTAGVTYSIQLVGYNDEEATNIVLGWSLVPTNDAKFLSFGPGAIIGTPVSNAAAITWNVLEGTPLAPTFTLSAGATCTVGGSPVASGDLIDFSGGPVVFVVTAQGPSPIVNSYTVTASAVGKMVLWDISGAGDWDTTTVNWLKVSTNVPDTFADGDGVIFNNPAGGAINIPSSVSPHSITVGSTSGDYSFSGAAIGGTGSLTMEGSGTLTLSSPNTYSGATVVNTGTLHVNGNGAIGGSTSFTVADGASLLLTGSTGNGYPWPANPAPLAGAGALTVPAPGLGNVSFKFDMSAFTGVLNLAGGQFAVNPFYSPGFVAPVNGTINVQNGTNLYLGWQGTTFTTNVKLSGGTDNGEGLGVLRGDSATLNGAVILATNSTIGSAGGTLTINAVIGDEGNDYGFTTVGSPGTTVILTAANTYTGQTTINSGTTLQCNTPNSLGGGALSINGKANLNYSGTKAVDSLTLGGVAQTVSGTYGSVASLATFQNDTYFTPGSTGTVTVTVASGFATWAAANAPGQTPAQDHDSDGVDNGIEYFMGETGSSFTAMPGLDGTNTVTWTKDTAYQGTWQVQTSPNLSTWTNVTGTDNGTSVSYLLPPGLGTHFVRLLVTPTL